MATLEQGNRPRQVSPKNETQRDVQEFPRDDVLRAVNEARLLARGSGPGGGDPELPPGKPSAQARARLYAAGKITERYQSTPSVTSDTPVGSMETKAERIAIMQRLGQADDLAATEQDNVRCGPASLLAGAMLDKDGIKTVIDTLKKDHFARDNEQVKEILAQVEKSLEEGNLTYGDLSKLQEALHIAINEGPATAGSSPVRIASYIHSHPELRNLLQRNKVTIVGINNDPNGSGDANHAVMRFVDPESGKTTYYDPAAPDKDGSHLVSDERMVNVYNNATQDQAFPLSITLDNGETLTFEHIREGRDGTFAFIAQANGQDVSGQLSMKDGKLAINYAKGRGHAKLLPRTAPQGEKMTYSQFKDIQQAIMQAELERYQELIRMLMEMQ